MHRRPQGAAREDQRNPTFSFVREATNTDDVVRSRLRSVLAETDISVRDRPSAQASTLPTPAGSTPPGWPTGDEGPLAWRDLIPSWPDDIDLDPDESPPSRSNATSAVPAGQVSADALSAPLVASAPSYEWRYNGDAAPCGEGDDDESDVPGGQLGRRRLEPDDDEQAASAVSRSIGAGAFDPGRRGVRALAAVAAFVVLIAAFLAWRARPRVDPVPAAAAAPAASGDVPAAVSAARTTPGGEVVIAVGGKVKKPGLVRLPAGSRVADALQAAGGADNGVDVALLNLARKVVDGELILVGVTPPPGAAVATGPAAAPAAGGPAGPVNLNAATLADLDTLPGVGPVLAQRILDAREAQGGFTSVSDLRKVDGIGDARFEQLKDLVTV